MIAEELLRSIARAVRDEGIATISVKQNPRIILSIVHTATVPCHGTLMLAGESEALLADRVPHDRSLAVAKT